MKPTTTGWGPAEYRAAIDALGRTELRDANVVLASNRGPVEFRVSEEGEVLYRRGQGGLVTAVSSMVEVLDTCWIAAPMSQVDMAVAEAYRNRIAVEVGDRALDVGFVQVDPQAYRKYYDTISNALLWFLQHGIHDAPHSPDFDPAAWDAWESYRKVNRLFAEQIAARFQALPGKRPVAMVHDYHLYLVPGFLRELAPDAVIQHFTHISWPHPQAWYQLPRRMRDELLHGLLSCDIVGFHTPAYVRAFLATCRELLGLQVDEAAGEVLAPDGRVVRVRAYPISIDPEALSAFAGSAEVLEQERDLLKGDPDALRILQVARTDPSKNLLRSFKAFELFLEKYPRMIGKVRFWALLPASRQTTGVYRRYLDEVKDAVDNINRRFRRAGYKPVEMFLDNSYARAIAAMKHYDALLVNSLADGMNLVAKEGPVVNGRDGVLVLSETTGVCDELGDAAICLNPYDLVETCDALHEALTLPRAERRKRQAQLKDRIVTNSIFRWAHDQLVDILELGQASRLVSSPFLAEG